MNYGRYCAQLANTENMGGGGSVHAKKPSVVVSQSSALSKLELVANGTQCLHISGEHAWHEYEGQHGAGRACEQCFRVERKQPFEVVFKIQPRCEEGATPTATAILNLWQVELERVTAGGCLAGGEHRWTDVRKTLVRLNCAGRCCEKCGRVESDSTDGGDDRVLLTLPNLVGHFGPPVAKEYREIYGGSRMEVPRERDIIRVGLDAGE